MRSLTTRTRLRPVRRCRGPTGWTWQDSPWRYRQMRSQSPFRMSLRTCSRSYEQASLRAGSLPSYAIFCCRSSCPAKSAFTPVERRFGVRRGVAALGFSFWDFVAASPRPRRRGGHGRMEMAKAETQSGDGSPHSKTSNRVEIVVLSAALECGEASPLWVFLFGIWSPRRRGRGGGAAAAGWKWPKPKPKAATARRTTWHQWIKNAGFESRNPKRRWLAALQKPQRTSRLILPIWYTTYHVNLNRGTGRGRGH